MKISIISGFAFAALAVQVNASEKPSFNDSFNESFSATPGPIDLDFLTSDLQKDLEELTLNMKTIETPIDDRTIANTRIVKGGNHRTFMPPQDLVEKLDFGPDFSGSYASEEEREEPQKATPFSMNSEDLEFKYYDASSEVLDLLENVKDYIVALNALINASANIEDQYPHAHAARDSFTNHPVVKMILKDQFRYNLNEVERAEEETFHTLVKAHINEIDRLLQIGADQLAKDCTY